MGPHPQGDFAPRPPYPGPSGPVEKPGLLKATVAAVAAVALSTFAFLAVALSGGRESMRPFLDKIVKEEAGEYADLVKSMGKDLLEQALDEAYGTLVTRAFIFTFFGVIILLCALFMASGRNWARVLFQVIGLIVLMMNVLDMGDDTPSALHIIDGICAALIVIAMVMMWLGPNNRYMKAKKQERKGKGAPAYA